MFTNNNLVFLRCHHHDHLPSFHLRHLLDNTVLLQIIPDPRQQIRAQFLVRHLPTPESQSDLGLIPVFEELYKLAQLDPVITFVRSRPKLNFLNMYLLLLAVTASAQSRIADDVLVLYPDVPDPFVRVFTDIVEGF